MFNWKGVIAGTLLYIAVEVVLFIRALPPQVSPPPEFAATRGVVGYDLVTYFHNNISGAILLVGLIVFWSLASRFFQRGTPVG